MMKKGMPTKKKVAAKGKMPKAKMAKGMKK
jgi:hypothetical protein